MQYNAIQCNTLQWLDGWIFLHLQVSGSYKTQRGWFSNRNRPKSSANNHPDHPPPSLSMSNQPSWLNLTLIAWSLSCPYCWLWCSGVWLCRVQSASECTVLSRCLQLSGQWETAGCHWAAPLHIILIPSLQTDGPEAGGGKDCKDKVAVSQWHSDIISSYCNELELKCQRPWHGYISLSPRILLVWWRL